VKRNIQNNVSACFFEIIHFIDHERKEKTEDRKLMQFSEQIFELVSIFKEASRNFLFIFSFNRPG
jgi:hypothetical protein